MSRTISVSRRALAPAVIFAFALAARAQDAPSITGPLNTGSDVVRGNAGGADAVSIWINLKQAGGVAPSGGKFAIPLDNPLKCNDVVEVRQTVDGKLLESQPLTVQGSCKADSITFVSPKEGDTTVSGTFNGTDISAIKVEVVQGDRLVEPADATVDTKKLQFTATLKNALTEDESIHAHGENTNGAEITSAAAYSNVEQLGYDWGRVRAYFSAGAEWVRNDSTAMTSAANAAPTTNASTAVGTFGSPSAFLGLNIDYNWWNSAQLPRCVRLTKQELADKSLTTELNNRQAAMENAAAKAVGFATVGDGKCQSTTKTMFLLNTYFDARLTDIPISQSSNSTSGGSSNTGSAAGTASTGQFQGGYFEGGAYFPIVPRWAQWQFHGQGNGLFIAPLAKLGFQAGDVSVSSTDPEKFDVFRFYGFGVKIGHFKLYDKPQSEAPQLLSYLDITGGRWDNFRIYPSGTNEVYRRPWRLDATARFKIPLTPLYVGGEVNVGSGPDDMRIFVGTRIDIGKVVTALIPALK